MDPYWRLERLEVAQALALDLVAIGGRSTSEVLGSVGVALHGPQHPIEDSLSETAAEGITKGTAVADINVALPDGDTLSHVLVVALALWWC